MALVSGAGGAAGTQAWASLSRLVRRPFRRADRAQPFDSTQLVAMYYEEDGSFASAEIIDDPQRVVEANYWRDVAQASAISYREFAHTHLDQPHVSG